MPSTAGIVASGSAQLDQWLRANLIAFDERRSSPLTNLGTLGAAGDATATGTRRLVNTGATPILYLPGVEGNTVSCTAPASATQYVATPSSGAPTTGPATGGAAFSFSSVGSWVSVALLNSSNVTVAEYAPAADEATTGGVDAYGVTWAIHRSRWTGYQTSVVLPFSAKRLFDAIADALTVAHSAGLNLGTGSFSVWWLGRRFATTLSNGILISKWDSAGSRGWRHMNNLATADTLSIVDDGPLSQIGAVAAGSFGTLALQGFTVDRSAGVVRSFFNDAEASVALGARADFDTTADIRFGRSGTSPSQPLEAQAWGIYPGALTAAQLAALRDALLVPERAAA